MGVGGLVRGELLWKLVVLCEVRDTCTLPSNGH